MNPNAAAFVPRNPQMVHPRQPTVAVVPKQTVSGQAIIPGTKQTLITNHVTHLPSHVLQQMYAGKIMYLLAKVHEKRQYFSPFMLLINIGICTCFVKKTLTMHIYCKNVFFSKSTGYDVVWRSNDCC